MYVQDRVTQVWYDPIAVWTRKFQGQDMIDMLTRMQNEEGRGWPKRTDK